MEEEEQKGDNMGKKRTGVKMGRVGERRKKRGRKKKR